MNTAKPTPVFQARRITEERADQRHPALLSVSILCILVCAGISLCVLTGREHTLAGAESAPLVATDEPQTRTLDLQRGTYLLRVTEPLRLAPDRCNVQPIGSLLPSCYHDDVPKGGGELCGGRVLQQIKNNGNRNVTHRYPREKLDDKWYPYVQVPPPRSLFLRGRIASDQS